MLNFGKLGCDLGKGLIAGLAGTAVMSIISIAAGEKEEGQRAHVAGKALGFQPAAESAKSLSQMIHWEYGMMWGGVYGLMRAFGLRSTALHFAAVYSTAGAMLTSLGVAPPPTQQPPSRVAFDAFRHFAYSYAVARAYDRLHQQEATLDGPGPVFRRSEQPYLTSPAGVLSPGV